MGKLLYGDLTKDIIGAAFDVQKELGYGFLERVYENAMLVELRGRGRRVEQQVPIDVHYKGERIGHYVADLVVGGKVLVELKTGKELLSRHEAQLLHYLKATGIKVGLLINFGREKCEFKRMVM
jgi:GxxExxY protein